MRKPGCTEPVFYFVNGADPAHEIGYIMMAPYSECPTPKGYRREYVDTLPDIDRLEAKLQAQERREWELEVERDEVVLYERRKARRDRMYQALASSETDEWTKEFYRLWIQLEDDKKRAMYAQRFLERQMYLWARHNDTGNRRADEEVFKPERHTVQS